MSQKPIVAVTTDVKFVDGYNWHATVETYLKALVRVADVIPVLVPSLGDEIDFADLLARVDGVLVTGSRSNVHPELYGAEETEITGPHDRDRDGTSLPLIRDAIDAGVPMLAICRGIQELNVALDRNNAKARSTGPETETAPGSITIRDEGDRVVFQRSGAIDCGA